jgi:hypothetical protein
MGPRVKQTLYLVGLLASLVGVAWLGKKFFLPKLKKD